MSDHRKNRYTGSISFTAWLVALCQGSLRADSKWQGLLKESERNYYRHCLSHCKRLPFYKGLGLFPPSAFYWFLERMLAYGVPYHFAARKRAIERQWQEALEQGARQLVVLGGGFDALALHTAKNHPQIHCFEIDRPVMQHHKQQIILECYGAIPANFHSIGQDLSQSDLLTALTTSPAFDRNSNTVIVAEGLTMYLSPEHVVELLAAIRKLGPGTQVIFTAVEPSPFKSGLFAVLRNAILALSGERFAWNIYQKDMAAFLSLHGFSMIRLMSYADIQSPWRTEMEQALLRKQNGEYLVYAVCR